MTSRHFFEQFPVSTFYLTVDDYYFAVYPHFYFDLFVLFLIHECSQHLQLHSPRRL
jgi:hypothetical protein